MRILCIADHIDPLVYSPNIRKRFSRIDFVLSAGDLSMSYYDFIVSMLNKPLFFVFGNHKLDGQAFYLKKKAELHGLDAKDPYDMKYYTGSTYINKKSVNAKGLLIAGLGGSVWYNGGQNQFTDRRMFRRILVWFRGSCGIIFVTVAFWTFC